MTGDSSAKRSHSELGADFLVETKLEKEMFTVLWTIENYREMSQLGELLTLGVVGGPKNQLSWRLTIEPRRMLNEWDLENNRTDRTPYFAVSLQQQQASIGIDLLAMQQVKKADLEVTLLDAHEKPSTLSQFRPLNEIYEHDRYLPRHRPVHGWDKGMPTSAVAEAVVDDKLKLLLQISIYDEPKYTVDGVAVPKIMPTSYGRCLYGFSI